MKMVVSCSILVVMSVHGGTLIMADSWGENVITKKKRKRGGSAATPKGAWRVPFEPPPTVDLE
jgi:hypothetical protein